MCGIQQMVRVQVATHENKKFKFRIHMLSVGTDRSVLQNVWSEKTLGLIFLKVRKLRKNMQAFRNIVP